MTRESKLKRAQELLEYLVADAADVFILMADLSSSTAFKSRLKKDGLPEILWIQRQVIFLQRVAERIEAYHGTVVKTIGDEVMAIFPATTAPEDVLKCAIEILQVFDNYKLFQGVTKIEAKVSIDYGTTYNGSITNKVPYDPIGTPVDRCARLGAITKKREVSFSQDFLEMLIGSSSQEQIKEKYAHKTNEEALKGIGRIPVHRISAK